jgi:hypothetical protein
MPQSKFCEKYVNSLSKRAFGEYEMVYNLPLLPPQKVTTSTTINTEHVDFAKSLK